MITAKQVKDIAALIGAVAGIFTGIDKTKTIATKWVAEYKEKKYANRIATKDTQSERDKELGD